MYYICYQDCDLVPNYKLQLHTILPLINDGYYYLGTCY